MVNSKSGVPLLKAVVMMSLRGKASVETEMGNSLQDKSVTKALQDTLIKGGNEGQIST